MFFPLLRPCVDLPISSFSFLVMSNGCHIVYYPMSPINQGSITIQCLQCGYLCFGWYKDTSCISVSENINKKNIFKDILSFSNFNCFSLIWYLSLSKYNFYGGIQCLSNQIFVVKCNVL